MNAALITPVLLLVVAFVLAMSWWFVRDRSGASRRLGLMFLCGALFGIPWLAPRDSIIGLGLLMLASCAVFAPKLLDAHLDPDIWRERRFGQWLIYLVNPFILCYRRHLADQPRPHTESIRGLLRGALEMAAGAAVLQWAFTRDWSDAIFLLEHTTKLIGIYLLAFDGMFVTMNSLLRLAGGRYLDFSRHPIIALTPADFWRRYNRDAGRFLYEDVYRRLGIRSPRIRILCVFMLNGLLHEYLLWIMCGQITGVMLLFFAIQGLAVIVSWRFRPRGVWTPLSMVATGVFNIATTVLFFRGVDLILPWYA